MACLDHLANRDIITADLDDVTRLDTNFGLFVPWTFCSLEDSFLCRFVPQMFHSNASQVYANETVMRDMYQIRYCTRVRYMKQSTLAKM